MSNTQIWDRLESTDPRFQKDFSRGGGFRGTAINPTYVARKMTEMFGPCGTGWGFEVVDEKYVTGAPVGGVTKTTRREGEQTVYAEQEPVYGIIHVVRVRLWYVLPGHDERRFIEQYGQTTFVGKDKNGIFTDEEAPKKSITDGWTKAATLLGASADIYLGGIGFGDNKYVNEPTGEAIEGELVRVPPSLAKDANEKTASVAPPPPPRIPVKRMPSSSSGI